jgi:glyoxylase-like metal-dependent hydrolase (beta-lactamase superfamily II)
MKRLWGEVVPVPEANLRVLSGGETIGPWRVQYTPGHASHHVSYLHEPTGTAFVGDVGGVRIPPSPLVLPPTPPPDIDLEAWHESIDTVAAWRPRRLAMTHFGAGEDPPAQLAEVSRRLDAWAQLARDRDEAGFIEGVTEEIERAADPETAAAFAQAAPPDQLYAGLARYWQKRAERG